MNDILLLDAPITHYPTHEQLLLDRESESDYIKTRITNILKNYPVLSPSMLQLGMGPAMRARIWKPILEQMIKEGSVLREFISTPSERGGYRTICRIQLAPITTSQENQEEQAA